MDKPQGMKDYLTKDGKYPVREWLDSLDRGPRATVLTYIGRVREGNFSNCENKGGGLHEIKINIGPGYRVYYTWVRGFIVLLLSGGTKRVKTGISRPRVDIWKTTKREMNKGKQHEKHSH